MAAALAAAAVVSVLVRVAAGWVLAQAGALARDLRALREAGAGDPALAPPLTAKLPAALAAEREALAGAHLAQRRDGLKAARAAAARAGVETSWLEAILSSLAEPVIVAARDHRILLYNPAAAQLPGARDRIGLGRDLGAVLDLAPVEAALARAEATGREVTVTCAPAGGGAALAGRAALLRAGEGGGKGGASAYLLSFPPPGEAEVLPLPPRPEFYDFALMEAHRGAALADRALAGLDYVVFDCEMTGLMPERGDEIIQIGAVRVLGGRVLTGEAREWLVDPGRPIPPGSVRFHGLTDADVAGAPGITSVLPEFRDFAGGAVLVAHNAAFDMAFLELHAREAGVAFDNPVLDTMLLSVLLDGDGADHSFDGLRLRYGVAMTRRHSALADARATAELLVRMLERLEARGLTSFGAVMRESDMAARLRNRAANVRGR